MSQRVAIFGVPISWIALWGAFLGATAIIPLAYWAEGGGVHPLSTALLPICAMVLGPYGGAIAAIIGGIIGMFLNPLAFPYGPLGIVVMALVALWAGLIVNGKWKWVALFTVILFVSFMTIPYVYPGPPTYHPWRPDLLYILTFPRYIEFVLLIILGWKYLPKWVKSESRKALFAGVFFTAFISRTADVLLMIGSSVFHFYTPDLWWFVLIFSINYEDVLLSIAAAAIGAMILTGLRATGLRRIPRAIW